MADLETLQITRDGQPFKNADFNFWGVTFAQDSNTFYATLGTGGRPVSDSRRRERPPGRA